MNSAPQKILITSETQAFLLLQASLQDEFKDQNLKIEFSGWPLLTLRLEGEGYDSTVTSAMAVALVDLQHAMNRNYARMVHGTSNPNILTHQTRQSLTFKAKVEKGSSLVKIDLGDYASELAIGLAGKMDGSQVVALALGAAVTAGSVIAYKAYLRHKSEDKKADLAMQERVALSQEESKRLELMQQVIISHPQLEYARQDFDDARHSVLKSVGDATSIEHQGVELTREIARKVAASPRAASTDVQLNGYYLIEKLDWTKEGEVRISVSSTETHREFIARLGTSAISNEQKETLKSAEWDRTKLHLQINATLLRGEVTTAVIVGVEWVKPKSAEGAAKD